MGKRWVKNIGDIFVREDLHVVMTETPLKYTVTSMSTPKYYGLENKDNVTFLVMTDKQYTSLLFPTAFVCLSLSIQSPMSVHQLLSGICEFPINCICFIINTPNNKPKLFYSLSVHSQNCLTVEVLQYLLLTTFNLSQIQPILLMHSDTPFLKTYLSCQVFVLEFILSHQYPESRLFMDFLGTPKSGFTHTIQNYPSPYAKLNSLLKPDQHPSCLLCALLVYFSLIEY